VILERVIITGYPYKINRRRSTVRYMFFNPGDVKYFRPIEVRTKMGLRVIVCLFRVKSRNPWVRTAS